MYRKSLAFVSAALVVAVSAPAPAANGPSAVFRPQALVSWADPTENAFTVDVPEGWQIHGGTHRNSPIDARNYVSAKSPDGSILAFVDAPNILPRQVPNPQYDGLGYFEGRTVQSPAGPLKIERFRTGSQYASDVAAVLCPNPERLSGFDLNRQSGRINAAIAPFAAQYGARALASAGDFTFRCGAQSGFVYAVTVLASASAPGGPQTWTVDKLAGYLADRPRAGAARNAMNAMLASLTLDPAWQLTYQRQINDTTGALTAIGNRIAQASIQQAQQSLRQSVAQVERSRRASSASVDALMSGHEQRQATYDHIAQQRSDATLGIVHGCDDLGNCATVSNESQYHWVDRSGSVVPGPSDGTPPGPHYRAFTPDSQWNPAE